MDEWNYWCGQYLYGELGVRYFLTDALGVGKGLYEYCCNSDLYFMANYAQTVNVIGAIKTTPTASAFDTTGLALKLYRREFGTIPIEVSGTTGNLDIAAAWTTDKKVLTVAIVNPEAASEQVVIDLGPARIGARAKRWLITGAGPQSYNEPGKNPGVVIRDERTTVTEGSWKCRLSRWSYTEWKRAKVCKAGNRPVGYVFSLGGAALHLRPYFHENRRMLILAQRPAGTNIASLAG